LAGAGLCQGQAYLLYDLEVETLQRGYVRGGVREQANLANVQVGKDLTAKPYLAQNSLVLAAAFFAVQAEPVRNRAAVNLESPAGVVKIDQGTPPRFRNHLKRALHHLVAIA
jgi:hypothetical protein